jgi:hypothetical protein
MPGGGCTLLLLMVLLRLRLGSSRTPLSCWQVFDMAVIRQHCPFRLLLLLQTVAAASRTLLLLLLALLHAALLQALQRLRSAAGGRRPLPCRHRQCWRCCC